MPIQIPGFVLGTDYKELPGARLWVEDGKLRGERKFHLLNYDVYPGFLAALAGGVTFNGAEVTQVPPVAYRSDVQGVFCRSAHHEGIGVPTRAGNGDETFSGGAFIYVDYRTLDFNPTAGGTGDPNNPVPGPYMTESGSTSSHVVTRTKKSEDGEAAWFWSDNQPVTEEAAPDIVAHEVLKSYTITRHNVPTYPRSTIDSLVGKVNSGTFPATASAGAFPAETLKFEGDDFNRETFSDGTRTGWTIAMRFTSNKNGWNKIYRPSSGAFETIENVDGEKLYETGDFSQLLV